MWDGSNDVPRNIAAIVVEERVTDIGDCAFRLCESLTSIELPRELAKIGKKAFYGCMSLKCVDIPKRCTQIDDYAFCWDRRPSAMDLRARIAREMGPDVSKQVTIRTPNRSRSSAALSELGRIEEQDNDNETPNYQLWGVDPEDCEEVPTPPLEDDEISELTMAPALSRMLSGGTSKSSRKKTKKGKERASSFSSSGDAEAESPPRKQATMAIEENYSEVESPPRLPIPSAGTGYTAAAVGSITPTTSNTAPSTANPPAVTIPDTVSLEVETTTTTTTTTAAIPTTVVEVETVEERQRRLKSEARAKKFEAMAAQRRRLGASGTHSSAKQDAGTATTGFSKSHRMRRKKSAAHAAGTIQARWKKDVFRLVLDAERAKWRRCIVGRVVAAEETRATKAEERRAMEELDERARRRREDEAKQEERAKKLRAREVKFRAMREGKLRGNGADSDDDCGSVVSSARRRRMGRGRKANPNKSKAAPEMKSVKEVKSSAFSPEEDEKASWKRSVFSTVIKANEAQWRRLIFVHVIESEPRRDERVQKEKEMEKQRAAVEVKKEKERQNMLRAEKMKKFQQIREAASAEAQAMDPSEMMQSPSTKGGGGGNAMKRMRDRRRKAAAKKSGQVQKVAVEEKKEDPAEVAARKINAEKAEWCNTIFGHVIAADAKRWQKHVFHHVLLAEGKRDVRVEAQKEMERIRAIATAKKEKERQMELRALKMQKFQQAHRSFGTGVPSSGASEEENVVPNDTEQQQGGASKGGGASAMKKMRDRRRKAAMAKKAAMA